MGYGLIDIGRNNARSSLDTYRNLSNQEQQRKQVNEQLKQQYKQGIASGIGTGATLGATIGSVVPVVGTVAGGAIGAVLGGLAASFFRGFFMANVIGSFNEGVRVGAGLIDLHNRQQDRELWRQEHNEDRERKKILQQREDIRWQQGLEDREQQKLQRKDDLDWQAKSRKQQESSGRKQSLHLSSNRKNITIRKHLWNAKKVFKQSSFQRLIRRLPAAIFP